MVALPEPDLQGQPAILRPWSSEGPGPKLELQVPLQYQRRF